MIDLLSRLFNPYGDRRKIAEKILNVQELPPMPKIKYDWWATYPEDAYDYNDFQDKIKDRMGRE